MIDPIDRQQAIDAVEQWEDGHTWDDWCNEHKDEKERFHIVPPSDYIRSLPYTEPRMNGRWETDSYGAMDDGEYLMTRCSVCGTAYEYGHDDRYCGFCGAEMTEGEEDDND